ncbi:cytochrome c biogenesis protein CcmA [Sedimentisphaera salicampi]|uniref:Cytochrome c biogenesis protein CcmA n=2 Tax=Sedimentisphaera salicampi TaxID=1941349 RepID=A0A1W6LMZ9_9BACT|nr:cytochrome c biogenesis protein CcmA [Sedimentisphaera salicampi]OXU14754.1 cytochrome c biogenesis protein CcmA [Sedimentisphaera salicampi]
MIQIDSFIPRSYCLSRRSEIIMRTFGISESRLKEKFRLRVDFSFSEAEIVLIKGASGSGKSTLLSSIKRALPEQSFADLDDLQFSRKCSIIDCFPTFTDGMKRLADAGLSSAWNMIKPFSALSVGEKFRFRLALAMSGKEQTIICDEFCSSLEGTQAKLLSARIRLETQRTRKAFILCTTRQEIEKFLIPEVVITLSKTGRPEVQRRGGKNDS